MDESTRKALDAFDVELLGTMKMAEGAKWPAIALAAAMIDAGVVEKRRLLQIIDALHGIATLHAADALGGIEDATHSLEELRGVLEVLDLKPGRVVEELQAQESLELLVHRLREELRQQPPGANRRRT